MNPLAKFATPPARSSTTCLRAAAVLGLALILSACVTSPKVEVRQARDGGLSCAGLADELGALDATETQIRNSKNPGSKAVGAILWLPGYVYSQNDQARALRLIAERRAHLQTLRQRQGC